MAKVPAIALFGFKATISNPFLGLAVDMLTFTVYVVFGSYSVTGFPPSVNVTLLNPEPLCTDPE
ncbi:hypothetical protein D3C85_1437220 [compost metagenome]